MQKMETKQTATEWLQECLSSHLSFEQQMQFEGLFQQAKQMEQKQMLVFAYKVIQNSECSFTGIAYCDDVEKIYNETYGN